MRSRLILLGVASASLLGAQIYAQPVRVDHRGHGPVRVVGGPTEAPPQQREEHMAARAGFEWIPGRWDWRGNKWTWDAGRWEKEHAGQHWNPGHWDHNGPTWAWTEGGYAAAAAVPPPMPPPGEHPMPMPPPPGEHPPHAWHNDRPTVSSYWPMKGKAGTRVVIHGTNFPPDAQVLWGPDPVRAAKVSEDRIMFEVPPAAQSATILIKHGGNRDLVVGNFEVANFDADADAKRIEAQRMAAAQTAWAASQARMAHDQAARQAAMDAQYTQMDTSRDQRREQRAEEIRQKWHAAFLSDPDTQAELTLHAQRVADLARAKDVAGVTANAKLGVRVDVATGRENDRHDQRMAALQTAFNARGGAK